jgi:hypothetical protein
MNIDDYVLPKRSREDGSGIRRNKQKLAGYEPKDVRKPNKQKSKRSFDTTENYW